MRLKWKNGCAGIGVTLPDLCPWHMDETYVKVNGRWAYLYWAVEGRCPSDVEHRQIKYRNNVIECDHGKLKRIIGATLGFKSMKTAYATIKGIEVMRALRKGQALSILLW